MYKNIVYYQSLGGSSKISIKDSKPYQKHYTIFWPFLFVKNDFSVLEILLCTFFTVKLKPVSFRVLQETFNDKRFAARLTVTNILLPSVGADTW